MLVLAMYAYFNSMGKTVACDIAWKDHFCDKLKICVRKTAAHCESLKAMQRCDDRAAVSCHLLQNLWI